MSGIFDLRKVKNNKEIIEERLGRAMTDQEIDNFNRAFAPGPVTMKQLEQWINNTIYQTMTPEGKLQQDEMKKLEKEFKEGQKRKEREDKAKLLEMEEKEREARVKRQIAEHLYGETTRHKAIRARWETIQREIRDLTFYGHQIKNSEQRIKNLETEREELKKEYISLPFEYPKRTFSQVIEYRYTEDMKFVLENGEWKFKYKNTDVRHTPIYENGVPIAVEIEIGNYTLSQMFASAFYKQKVRIPVRFNPSLKPKEEIAKSNQSTEKKGILEKIKHKL